MPIPMGYIDIIRTTNTDLDTLAEKEINDYWIETGAKELSGLWVGRTIFHLLHPSPPPGKQYINGVLHKKQKTIRLDDIWPEVWTKYSTK